VISWAETASRCAPAFAAQQHVVAGEVPLALTVYNFMQEAARQGAATDWFVLEPASRA